MATFTFTKKELEQHLKLAPAVLEKIRLLGIPVAVKGEEVTIEVLPNRPDLFSLQGFLRAVLAFLGKAPGQTKYKVTKPDKVSKVIVDPSVKHIRPYTVCARITGLKLNDANIRTLIDMQEKLHTTIGRNRKRIAIGIYPMEKITFPIRYEARKPGDIIFRPLEGDKELSANEILKLHPAGRTYAHLLEGCKTYPLFIDAKKQILSMPPIINSHDTGKITEQTKEVFIECSGNQFAILKKTLNIIVTTLADMGGKIHAVEVVYEKAVITPDLTPETMKISLENTNNLLGLALKEKDLEKLLPKMGYDYKSGKVSIPAYRTDILHEVDIIEDIAIAYGYDKLLPEVPSIPTIGAEDPLHTFQRKVAVVLLGLGLLEISSYHLIKKEESTSPHPIEVENAKTEYKILRPNLTIPGLRILAENKDNEYPQRLFEIGTVFKRNKQEIQEALHLALFLTPSNFTTMKQTVDYLMRMLGLSYSLQEEETAFCIPGRAGSIICKGKHLGYLGEAHPETLKAWNIKMPLALVEINLTELFTLI